MAYVDQTNWIMNRAYLVNGHRERRMVYTGEPLMLACLVHSKGKGRDTKDMRDLRKIMRDQNLDEVPL